MGWRQNHQKVWIVLGLYKVILYEHGQDKEPDSGACTREHLYSSITILYDGALRGLISKLLAVIYIDLKSRDFNDLDEEHDVMTFEGETTNLMSMTTVSSHKGV